MVHTTQLYLGTLWAVIQNLRNIITGTVQRRKPLVICFEGNIAAGKTTVIENLAKVIGKEDVEILREPISLWRNFEGHNMLDLYYRYPKQFAFTIQTLIQTSLLHQYHKTMSTNRNKIILMERSMSSSKDFFIPIMRDIGYIDEHQMCVSSYLCDVFKDLFPVDAVIYLRSDPNQCMERIEWRGREEEVDRIDLQYVTQLHNRHEMWYPKSQAILVDTRDLNKHDVVRQVYDAMKGHKLL
jgi:deoxyadenosine/deoxycytidine kinase